MHLVHQVDCLEEAAGAHSQVDKKPYVLVEVVHSVIPTLILGTDK
jgi:hypothetical protein